MKPHHHADAFPFMARITDRRRMDVLDGVVIIKGQGAIVGVSLGSPLLRSCARVTRSSQITLGRTCFVLVLVWPILL